MCNEGLKSSFIIERKRHTLVAEHHFECSAHAHNISPLLGEIGAVVDLLYLYCHLATLSELSVKRVFQFFSELLGK